MRVIKNLDAERLNFNNPIVTLGTFDGLHLGHQFVLRKLAERAKSLNRESILITFDPHPKLIISGTSPKLIDTVDEKIVKLSEIGLDTVIFLPFTRSLADKTAQDFSEEIFIDLLNCSEIWIGHDHQFGKDRTGDFLFLKKWASNQKISVFQTEVISFENTNISSTKIRNAIIAGNMKLASGMLGSNYEFSGLVVKGKQLGRTIGFPTANLVLNDKNKVVPANGVYKVKVIHNQNSFDGVMNIGVKPTVEDSNHKSIEVHILDFDQLIYGELLQVEVLDFIRNEKKFDSLEFLKKQINEDIQTAFPDRTMSIIN